MADHEFDKELTKSIQVAKTKPRNFAIIAKGTTILKLLVERKPIKEGLLNKAKRECQGNAIIKGVVRGIGDELVFQTTEQPAITDVKLKAYLVDVSQLLLKARFELVPTLIEIDDGTPDDAPTPDAGLKSDKSPPISTPQTSSVEKSEKTEGEIATNFKAWAERLATAFKAASSDVQALLQPSLIQALSLGKAGRYADAQLLLQRVEDGLANKQLPVASPRDTSIPPDDAATFTARLKAIRSRYAEAIAGSPPNREVLEKAMAVVLETAKAGDYSRGLKVLEGLTAALDKISPIGVPTSKQGADRELGDEINAWDTALANAQDSLTAFQAILRQTGDPDLEVIATSGIDELLVKLPGELTTVLKSTRNNLTDGRETAQLQLKEHRKFLETDRLITELDENPFGHELAIRATLLQALNEVQRFLAPS
ncbi:MAG: hypothetical protein U1A77_17310 [Pirellulales bacterium]